MHAVASRPRVHADLRAFDRCAEEHDVAVDIEDATQLQLWACDSFITDEQPFRTVTVDGPHERAVGEMRWNAADDVDPRLVDVLAQHGCLAAVGVHREDSHRPFVAALHHDEQSMLRPVGRRDVLECGGIPAHGNRCPVKRHNVQ